MNEKILQEIKKKLQENDNVKERIEKIEKMLEEIMESSNIMNYFTIVATSFGVFYTVLTQLCYKLTISVHFIFSNCSEHSLHTEMVVKEKKKEVNIVKGKDFYRRLRRRYFDLYLEEIRRIKEEMSDVRRGMIGLWISNVAVLITRLIIGWEIIFGIVVITVFESLLWYCYRKLLRKYRELTLMDPDELLPLICVVGTIICLILSLILT